MTDELRIKALGKHDDVLRVRVDEDGDLKVALEGTHVWLRPDEARELRDYLNREYPP